MSASNYLENELADHIFRGRSFTAPSTLYWSLHTADPGETGANELTIGSNGYARVAVVCDYTQWTGTNGETTNVDSAGSGGQVSNVAAIAWPAVTGSDWPSVGYFACFDAATGGNCIVSGQMTAPKTFTVGTVPTASPGTLTVTVS